MPLVVERWTDPAFVADATAWVDARLHELGLARTGDAEQPHVRPWSTALRVPTTGGPVWFKANHEPLRHEAVTTELVARRCPGRVLAPLAIDPETGWMLSPDAGRRLREVVEEERSLARWHDVLDGYARIQLACEDDVDELVRLGVPDLRLSTLPDRYGALLTEVDEVDPRLPDPAHVARLCDDLAAYGVRETVQHDDLHDAQVFVGRDGTHLVTDWGDACVSHPFLTLSVTLEGVVAWGVDDVAGSEDVAPYLETYVRPYRERHAGDLTTAARLAMRLGWLCRAVNGHLAEDPGSTRTRLRMFLDGRTG